MTELRTERCQRFGTRARKGVPPEKLARRGAASGWMSLDEVLDQRSGKCNLLVLVQSLAFLGGLNDHKISIVDPWTLSYQLYLLGRWLSK